MNVRTIAATDDAYCIADLNSEWKIIAHSRATGWRWNGELASSDAAKFRAMAFPISGDLPAISCVTGRDLKGELVLYGRVYPRNLGEDEKRPRGFIGRGRQETEALGWKHNGH